MSRAEKAHLVERIEAQTGRKRQALLELGVARSGCYHLHAGKKRRRSSTWNRIMPNEEHRILAVAREFPELSGRNRIDNR